MKTLVLISVVVFASAAFAAADAPQVGMTEAKLVELMGSPTSKAVMGKKAIYRWPDAQVTLVDGKISEIQYRDRVAEKQNAEERAAAESRKQAAAKAEARQAAAESKQSDATARRSAASAGNAEEKRLTRAAYLQIEIKAIERQLSEDSKRSSFGSKSRVSRGAEGIESSNAPMSTEARALLNVRLEKARAELAGLR